MSKDPFEGSPENGATGSGLDRGLDRGTDRADGPAGRSGTDDVGRVLRQGLKSALARWVLAKRRGAGRGAPTTILPQDEATHAWDGQRHFAEDYTFVGAQPGLAVILRLEQLPGRDSQRIWAVVLLPSGAFAPPGGQLVLRTTGDDRWRAGGLCLDCETPLRRWALRFSGTLERQGHGGDATGSRSSSSRSSSSRSSSSRSSSSRSSTSRSSRALRVVGEDHRTRASIDLTFVATAPPYVPGTDDDPELLARHLGQATWDARLLQGVQAARRNRPRGYVQLGELHGTIALGDVLVPVRAASLRQHHWGVRDWGACDEAFECFWATDDRRRGWLHHARFPFVTLEGGFSSHSGGHGAAHGGEHGGTHGEGGGSSSDVIQHAARIEPVQRLGATFEALPRRAPARASLAVGEAEGTRHLELELVSDLSFVVDGRGRVDLALVRATGKAAGWGVWAGLHRTLPRP